MKVNYKRVNLVFNEEEYGELDKRAKSAGVTVSKLIKEVLHKSVTQFVPGLSEPLRKIGADASRNKDEDLDEHGFPFEKPINPETDVATFMRTWKPYVGDPEMPDPGMFSIIDLDIGRIKRFVGQGGERRNIHEDERFYKLTIPHYEAFEASRGKIIPTI